MRESPHRTAGRGRPGARAEVGTNAEQTERHVSELNSTLLNRAGIVEFWKRRRTLPSCCVCDSLTGLPNRAMFTELLKAEIKCETAARITVCSLFHRPRSFLKYQRQRVIRMVTCCLFAFIERLGTLIIDTLSFGGTNLRSARRVSSINRCGTMAERSMKN